MNCVKARTQTKIADSAYFCTNAEDSIGLGHIRRLLAIAQAARRRGFHNIFFAVKGSKEIKDLVSAQGFSLLDPTSLGACSAGLALIDRKGDLTDEVRSLKERGLKVCVIDNDSSARFLADLVVYPVAHYGDELDWSGFHGIKLVGSEYFPLSEEFLSLSGPCRRSGENILVTTGGTDPNRLSLRVLEALDGIQDRRIDLVVGPFCGYADEMHELRSVWGDNLKLHFEGANMAELMGNAALAVTAFGITLYELAYTGIPAIIINNYEEDDGDAMRFAKHGSAISLGYHESATKDLIAATVHRILDDKRLAGGMSDSGRCLVDGKGAERIVERLESLCENA
jgi:UDP-2,4-diacetamido-2,4,6-trideoxy-beta-L-altropyranose hydrolase